MTSLVLWPPAGSGPWGAHGIEESEVGIFIPSFIPAELAQTGCVPPTEGHSCYQRAFSLSLSLCLLMTAAYPFG